VAAAGLEARAPSRPGGTPCRLLGIPREVVIPTLSIRGAHLGVRIRRDDAKRLAITSSGSSPGSIGGGGHDELEGRILAIPRKDFG